jgi:hypothetical protein
MGEDDPVGLLMAVPGLSDDERRAVLGGNAARLLRLGGVRGGEVQPPASVTIEGG